MSSYKTVDWYLTKIYYYVFLLFSQSIDSSFPLGEGDWTNVIIPGVLSNTGLTHLRSYLISNLIPESEYECLVPERNRFGWSDASRLFTFFTSINSKFISPLWTDCANLLLSVPLAHDLEWRSAFSSSSHDHKPSFSKLLILLTILFKY